MKSRNCIFLIFVTALLSSIITYLVVTKSLTDRLLPKAVSEDSIEFKWIHFSEKCNSGKVVTFDILSETFGNPTKYLGSKNSVFLAFYEGQLSSSSSGLVRIKVINGVVSVIGFGGPDQSDDKYARW